MNRNSEIDFSTGAIVTDILLVIFMLRVFKQTQKQFLKEVN